MTQGGSTFDLWSLIFCGFAFVGLFYSSKLIMANGRKGPGAILGIYLLLQSVTLLEYVFFWTKLIYSFHFLVDISVLFPVLYGPLLLIYLEHSFGDDKPGTAYHIHFVPFLILLVFKMPFYFSSGDLKLYHILEIPFGKYFQYYPWFAILHMTVYSLILIFLIANRSGVGSMRAWARWIVGFFVFYVLLTAIYQILALSNTLTLQSDYFVSLASSATIFFIAWFGKGFPSVADGMRIKESLSSPSSDRALIIDSAKGSAPVKYRNSGLPKSLEVKLSQELDRLMQEHKLYKQNDLKLEMLAERLNTSKHFISQVINGVYHVNFFEYINLKRVEEAKQLLRSRPKAELNVIEVAYEVGFANKGTFNAVFKRLTGLTPTEFRAQSRQLLESRNN